MGMIKFLVSQTSAARKRLPKKSFLLNPEVLEQVDPHDGRIRLLQGCSLQRFLRKTFECLRLIF